MYYQMILNLCLVLMDVLTEFIFIAISDISNCIDTYFLFMKTILQFNPLIPGKKQ